MLYFSHPAGAVPIQLGLEKDMARTRTIPVVLNGTQLEALGKLSRSKTEEARRVQRAKILVMASHGDGDDRIADAVGLNKNSIRNTIKKYQIMGLDAALADLARSGRPQVIGDDAKAWVKSQACVKPTEFGYAQELWTIQKLTSHVHDTCVAAGYEALQGVAPSKIWGILDQDELKPRRIRYYLERRDPEFEMKMKSVLMVYKEVELKLNGDLISDEIIISYDEKPGIQAIANIAPDLQPTPEHGFVARDYEYKRLGTVSLLAGINLIDGEVTGIVRDSHKSSGFINFLQIIDEKYESFERIKLVLDNNSVHTSKETMRYLESRPGRFEFVFTPKHGSWLNLIECFFGKLSRVCLRGIRVKSKDELIKKIYMYLDEINKDPVVFRWKYKMDELEI
jgi:transposase